MARFSKVTSGIGCEGISSYFQHCWQSWSASNFPRLDVGFMTFSYSTLQIFLRSVESFIVQIFKARKFESSPQAFEGEILSSLMSLDRKGTAIVIMGVSGSGKSTIGGMLAEALTCSFLDADDFHSQASKEKMSKGIPLSDEDRIPWLEKLCDTIRNYLIVGKIVVLSCSALQKKYREILRAGDPDYKSSRIPGQVKFVCLQAPAEVIAARLERRATEGNHFMPATHLQSQLNLLQIDSAEGILLVDATLTPQVIVDTIKDQIMLWSF